MHPKEHYLAKSIEELQSKLTVSVGPFNNLDEKKHHLKALLGEIKVKEEQEQGKDEEQVYLLNMEILKVLHQTKTTRIKIEGTMVNQGIIRRKCEDLGEDLKKRYNQKNTLSPVEKKNKKGKRGRPAGRKKDAVRISDVNLAVLPSDDIQRIVECPICLNVPLGPIFSCVNGHIICRKCRPKISRCGLCRVELTGGRNLIVERIVESSRIVCEHRDQGCDVILTGVEMLTHVDSCGFRSSECILRNLHGCNQSLVEDRMYVNHLIKIHGFKKLRNMKGKFVFTHFENKPSSSKFYKAETSWFFGCTLFDGKVFFIRSYSFGLYILGSDTEAAKYEVKLSFKNTNNKKISFFEITVPVISIDKKEDETEQARRINTFKEMIIRCGGPKVDPDKWKGFNYDLVYQIARVR